MAKATKDTVSVTTVTLELTEQEALVVHALCGLVGGSATDTNRKHSSAVYKALQAAGVDSYPSRVSLGLSALGLVEFTQ